MLCVQLRHSRHHGSMPAIQLCHDLSWYTSCETLCSVYTSTSICRMPIASIEFLYNVTHQIASTCAGTACTSHCLESRTNIYIYIYICNRALVCAWNWGPLLEKHATATMGSKWQKSVFGAGQRAGSGDRSRASRRRSATCRASISSCSGIGHCRGIDLQRIEAAQQPTLLDGIEEQYVTIWNCMGSFHRSYAVSPCCT